MSDDKKKPVKPPKPKGLKILPISAEDIRDPQKFNIWIFSMGPLILQELFDCLPEAAPNEKVRILADLYKTTLSYRPYTASVAPQGGNDPAAELAALLAAPAPEEF